MKKILLALVLTSGVFLSWSCNFYSGPANPYYNGPSGGNRSQPTVAPTIAPTQSPTPPFISEWGVSAPNALAVAGNGYIYVAEGDGQSVSQVQLFNSSTNTPVTQWTGYGSTPFYWPDGIAVNAATTNVYVLDAGNPQDNGTTGAAVYEFTSAVSAVGITSWTGYGGSNFNNPAGIALDSAGNVYVADMDNFNVEEFGPGGSTLGEWNDSNNNNFWPAAVALDSSNNIYVVDAGNFVVWKLSSITSTPASWSIFSNTGTSPFYGLTVDSNSPPNVYVADYDRGVVDVYTNGGTLIGEMTGNFGAATPFMGPDALLLFNGNIYVGDYDSGTGNIQIFGPNTY
jgi:tripartite motif-containing protein 71